MQTSLQELFTIIEKKAVVHRKNGLHIAASIDGTSMPWILDFRSILLDASTLTHIAELFWDAYGDVFPFQVGGVETASLPILAAIALKGQERGTPIDAFYIRKSRKPEGLQKIIEGTFSNAPVILVDDLMNSGGTFLRQIKVVESEGRRVQGLFTLVRFKDQDRYTFLQEKNIQFVSLFTIGDFGLIDGHVHEHIDHTIFSPIWKVQHGKPNYFYRIPKSAPLADSEHVYFGTDDGAMRAVRQSDGSEIWNYKILGLGASGKTIFSSPALFENTLYFGAYDGNFYALDKTTGRKKWIYMDADWIGSSPCVAEDLELVFVGLEYGLWKKQGGIVALDARTGKKVWEQISMPEYTHGSPAYSKKYNAVAVGSNDGRVYLFRASDGTLLWTAQTQGEVRASLAFDEKRGYLVFGSFDGGIHVLHVKDGSVAFVLPTGVGIYSTPLVYGNHVYVAGLDKKMYCINLNTFNVEWTYTTRGRLFASPNMANGHLYIGSNDGRLYELDPLRGKPTGFFQTTERITNKVAYNKETGRFFLLTYANELYCLERKTA
jgi:outer membrane protein assembly factor BamB/orotate phosphoribosyltransferase